VKLGRLLADLRAKLTGSAPAQAQSVDPGEAALQRVIAERHKTDPLAGVKIGSEVIAARLMAFFKTERGVHVESYLVCLGALAGYACQVSMRETAKGATLVVAQGKDGKTYFFGDVLNTPLAESPLSLWSLIGGILQTLGKPLPDLGELFTYVTSTVGGGQFGIPRMPEDKSPGDLPINYLKVMGPPLYPVAKRFCDEPPHLPLLFGLTIQTLLVQAKDVIDPTLAARIVMETAIAMSKVDLPGTVEPGGWRHASP